MLTRCPSCQTTFKVTSDILRVAEGQVRCGRCQLQFNALLYLLTPQRDEAEVSIASRLVQPPQAHPTHERDPDFAPLRQPARSQDDQARFADTFDDLPFEEDTPALSDSDHEDHSLRDTVGYPEARVDDDARDPWLADDTNAHDTTHEAPGLTNPGIPARRDTRQQHYASSRWDDPVEPAMPDEHDDNVLHDTEAHTVAQAIADEDAQLQAEAEAIIAERRQRPTAWQDEPATVADDAADEDIGELDMFSDAPRRSALIWKLLVLPLVVVLAAQVIHNYRATLARHPQLGEPLQAVYTRLGLTLRPDWDLHAYEVRQWGVIADPAIPGTLVVRASIKNLATFAQPYPLLKLVLEDRWGEQVRARAFEPAEYLDALIAPERQLAPGQQAAATIAIVDPGPDAEGFRFDVCLRGAHGTVCAADLPRR